MTKSFAFSTLALALTLPATSNASLAPRCGAHADRAMVKSIVESDGLTPREARREFNRLSQDVCVVSAKPRVEIYVFTDGSGFTAFQYTASAQGCKLDESWSGQDDQDGWSEPCLNH